MAKRPTTTPEQEGIEFRPDGWDRFRAAVRAASNVGTKKANIRPSPTSLKPPKKTPPKS
jgi:hypothetical protein